jgi:ABC-type transport system involved in multi-copper enzyme maturation permease subunit
VEVSHALQRNSVANCSKLKTNSCTWWNCKTDSVCSWALGISTCSSCQLLLLLLYYYLFILTGNGILPGGSGITMRHNTQITHITQNNTPRSNEIQHTQNYTHNKGHTTHHEYNANTITTTTI